MEGRNNEELAPQHGEFGLFCVTVTSVEAYSIGRRTGDEQEDNWCGFSGSICLVWLYGRFL